MKKYEISLVGCDGKTEFEVDLTDSEYETVKKISYLSAEKSEYSCMPILDVMKIE